MIWTALFFIVMAVLLVGFGFVGGCIFQQGRDRKMRPEPVADLYPEIPVDVRGHAELAQELVDTMSLQIVSFAPTPIVLELEAPTVNSPLLAIEAARDRYKARYEKADRLRNRYLRLLRVERARLAYFMGDVMDAPRRPTKAKLAAVILDMPRGGHLRLVKPTVANGWAAA